MRHIGRGRWAARMLVTLGNCGLAWNKRLHEKSVRAILLCVIIHEQGNSSTNDERHWAKSTERQNSDCRAEFRANRRVESVITWKMFNGWKAYARFVWCCYEHSYTIWPIINTLHAYHPQILTKMFKLHTTTSIPSQTNNDATSRQKWQSYVFKLLLYALLAD